MMAPPHLNKMQQQLRSVKWAQLVGAVVGVSIGCLIGMAPLAVMAPGFFDPTRQASAVAVVAAAAAGNSGPAL